MSSFLDSIATIVGVFQQHARGDGDGSRLSRRRMRELIQREFADSLMKPHDPQTIEKILQFLEWDGDGDIDFNEFLLLVFRVAKCCFWFQSRPPFLVQKTKLPTSVKSLREPEFGSRGSCRQLQEEEEEEEEQKWERNREVELQRDLRVREVEISEERRRDQGERLTRNGKDTEERCQNRRGELEQREREGRSCQAAELECPESRRPHQSYLEEPLEINLGECGREEREERGYGRRTRQEWELELAEREREIREEREERDDPRRKGRMRERRVDRERELEVEVTKHHSREREAEVAAIGRRDTREIREIHEIEDGRRQRETLRYERDRETSVEAVEADVKVRREIQERGEELRRRKRPCEGEQERRICPRREREEAVREKRIDQEQELELEEADGRRKRVIYERRRETSVAAAEADVKARREIRERGEELRRRERPCEGEEGRRISRIRERGEVLRERRINQEREQELELSKCRRQDIEEEVAAIGRRETWERGEREIREIEDGRRQRETLRYERDRETAVAAAEADIKVRREIRERGEELRRRERPCEGEQERRICPRREREEAVREKRIDQERELEASESHRWDIEEELAAIGRKETRERRDREIRKIEGDGRRQRETLRYERDRETSVAEAEADVKVRREIRERGEELRRRERPCEGEQERRISRIRERGEVLRERRIDQEREQELELSKCCRQDIEEEVAAIGRRETWERGEREIREIEDGRRQRETLRYERDRETAVAAAEVDVKVRREIRERGEELRRRERPCEGEQERRICPRREREEAVREKRIDQEQELEVCEGHRRDIEEEVAAIGRKETRERRDREIRKIEGDGRRQRETLRYERDREASVAEAEADAKVRREIRERGEELRRRERPCEGEEGRRISRIREREEVLRERRIDQEREQELELSKCCRQDIEEEVAAIGRRETWERGEREIREIEDGRRQRETLRYERDRETAVAAAEVDVKVRREIRERGEELRRRERPCEGEQERRICPRREREEAVREKRIDQEQELEVCEGHRRDIEEEVAAIGRKETRERRDREIRKIEGDGRRQRETLRYERDREASVAEAEADAKVRREIRERGEELRWRERPCEGEEGRRISRIREREEVLRERRIDQEREQELELSKCCRQDIEEEVAAIGRRETWERGEREIREIEDGRRQRETLRYERDRETAVAAAEVDVKVRREIRERGEELRRRERPCEGEQERRICPRREREEAVREKRIDQEQELEVCEGHRRDIEEEVAAIGRKETRERRDREIRKIEGDGRRQRETLRYERDRETSVAEAEADVKVRREIRERGEELRRRERPCEGEEERRISRIRERGEVLRERRIDQEREQELELSKCRRQDIEEEVAAIGRRETWERGEREIREIEDGRRQRETLRYERDRETAVAAAEVDVKVRREIRERGEELRRRERPCEGEQERRISRIRDRGEVLRERRIDEERELELEEADGRREQVTYERRRETSVAAAEADIKVRREILERGEELRRRERPCEGEEERRICPRREREETVRERRIDQEQELEASERRGRQTCEREAEVTTSDQRDAREAIRLEVLEEEDEEELEPGRCRYQTLDVDTGNLCPPGPISDLRVRYVPTDPEARPEVQLLPEPVEPQTVAYLVHVIQNRDDPKAATYEIMCHQPGQPGSIRTCSVCPRPPRDEATKSQENVPEDLDERCGQEVKDGALQDCNEPEAGNGQRVKSKEIRRRPEIPEVEQDQPQEEKSQKIPLECQESEAKSCAPECQERRDPGETCREGIQEGEEAPKKEPSKRSRRESGNSQVPREGGTKQGQESSKEG